MLILLFALIQPVQADLLPRGAQPHPGPRSNEQAEFLFKEASDAEKNGKIELAIEDYEKILHTYPLYSQKFAVYQQLMGLYLGQKKLTKVMELGKQAILQHPSVNYYNAIQLMRADAQLRSGLYLQTKVIVDELLRSKPEANTMKTALLYKAEALSMLGKHREAIASLDAAKEDSHFADAELKIKSRACMAKKPAKKEPLLDYFHEKNLCFKETAAESKSSPAKDSAQVWCDQFRLFGEELKKSSLDQFTREKLQLELESAKALSLTWGCS